MELKSSPRRESIWKSIFATESFAAVTLTAAIALATVLSVNLSAAATEQLAENKPRKMRSLLPHKTLRQRLPALKVATQTPGVCATWPPGSASKAYS